MKKDKELIFLSETAVKKIAGKPGEDVFKILFNKKNFNEFKIAEKLKKNINEVRNILYKLSSFNIVTSTRKKDKKKGWYTYFWTFQPQKALEVLLKFKEQELQNLEHILKSRLLKNFYFCESDNIEMSEDSAMHHNFLCPECGQLLKLVDEEKKVKEINQKIETIKKEIFCIRKKLEEISPKQPLKEADKKKREKNKKEKRKEQFKKIKKKSKKKNKK